MPKPQHEAQFTHLVSTLRSQFPHFAYIHVTEPPLSGDDDFKGTAEPAGNTEFVREAWGEREGSAYISAGGYSSNIQVAFEVVEKYGGAVAIGRSFIPNPDLVVSSSSMIEVSARIV